MEYIDFTAGYPEGAEDPGEGNSHQPQHFTHATNAPHQDQTNGAMFHHNVPQQISCDIKPRLTKEQHDILEAHYQKQPKPNTNTKKGFAEALSVSLDKVNVSVYQMEMCDASADLCARIGSRIVEPNQSKMRRSRLVR